MLPRSEPAGIRPKLQEPTAGRRDLVVSREADKGFPGLTNCLTIGEMVAGTVRYVH